jgi:AraC-like DNA-binding protein
MNLDFVKEKYNKELLIDCFQRNVLFKKPDSQKPFFVTFYEIIFITEGSGKFKLDNVIIPFKRGTVLLLPANKWRQWYKINEPYDGIYLIFEEEFISKFFNDVLYLYRFHYFYNTNTPSAINLSESELTSFLNKLVEVQNEIASLREDSSHLLRALLYYILINLDRNYQKYYQLNSIYEEIPLLKFKKLLQENIIEKQKVSEYADLLGISTSHLNKFTKKHLGKNASDIIKEQLVMEIKKKLLFTDKTISEIAYELNFSEASNFTRFFQKHTKLSPLDYRLQNDNY